MDEKVNDVSATEPNAAGSGAAIEREIGWLYERLKAGGRAQSKYGFYLAAYLATSWLAWGTWIEAPGGSTSYPLFGINIRIDRSLVLKLIPGITAALLVAWSGTFYVATKTIRKLKEKHEEGGGTWAFGLYDIDVEHNLIDWWDQGNPWKRFPWPHASYALVSLAGWLSIATAWVFLGGWQAFWTMVRAGAGSVSLAPDWPSVLATAYCGVSMVFAVGASWRIVFKRLQKFLWVTYWHGIRRQHHRHWDHDRWDRFWQRRRDANH